MAPRGRARAALLAALLAVTLVVPSLAARADLLGGLTDVVDRTVDAAGGTLAATTNATTDTVDHFVDRTEEVVDGTIGDTGTVLDEPVDSLTDTVDARSDSLTGTVDATADAVGDTVAGGTGAVRDTFDEDPVDPRPATTPVPATTTATTVPPATTTTSVPPTLTEDAPGSRDGDSTAAAITDPPSDAAAFAGEGLDVLAAAGGLSDPSVLEPVRIVAPRDDSLYGRLLDWLVGAGSGLLGILGGPLLALEILLRALLSAGSGLVAPASLLVSYLVRLVWESRARVPHPATAP